VLFAQALTVVNELALYGLTDGKKALGALHLLAGPHMFYPSITK